MGSIRCVIWHRNEEDALTDRLLLSRNETENRHLGLCTRFRYELYLRVSMLLRLMHRDNSRLTMTRYAHTKWLDGTKGDFAK